MSANPLVTLGELGQSPWYDFITRDLMASGELARLIREDGLRGMTSNPTIFEKAIAGSADYDADIRRLATQGKSPAEIFEALAVADVQAACDAFMDCHLGTAGHDGMVSLEVSPTLAYDTEGTITEATRLWQALDRPNAMIKIPGTEPGLAAVTACTAAGINVNVTLLFAVDRYEAVIDAYIRGVEARVRRREPVDGLVSVASFFVSRVDTRIDPMLDAAGRRDLRSRAAIANARTAYVAFEQWFGGERWALMAERGAAVQRPLWASTSTKDPALPDTYYVEALIGPHTVNTLPPDTYRAYRDHGVPALRIADEDPAPTLEALAEAGISMAEVTRFLEEDGVAKFATSYQSLLAGIEAKAATLVS